MSIDATRALIETYYATFNTGDRDAFLALLDDDVAHDINQGGREVGRDLFRVFLARMDRCYSETITDVVVMVNADGTRAAAEFVVHGTYLATDDGLPPASGQTYVLPAGAFFTVRDGKVARISNFYNLPDWTRQVTGGA
ncbi:ketosteroid isomerase-related protein [Gluconacetobacter tumulisoli]|uniref:SnoaL-like domain-containing protein n=1 Tax=Gluconacetobacter tumulisoli TaxID=1286189 RepID=A0A7W4K6R3_9PROT|nr:ketosteroid isomerase-related protein [Gluconacetobacter tumulisoli]MBB2201425.1 SnoaL-like domain-containing protein [Gluconacetobacter tumulisoli]